MAQENIPNIPLRRECKKKHGEIQLQKEIKANGVF